MSRRATWFSYLIQTVRVNAIWHWPSTLSRRVSKLGQCTGTNARLAFARLCSLVVIPMIDAK
jgi:hypothetical protein